MLASLPSLRTILFRLHWLLGLTAGLVLALVGVTGALLSYEEALTDLADRDRMTVTAREAPLLSPEALVARVEAQGPGRTVGAIVLSDAPSASIRVRFARDPKGGARAASVYADPYDGTVLGPVRLEGTFATIRALHRWLLIPGDGKGWGRSITGACTLALLAFLASGLYLRWPQIHRWRIWLKPSLSRPGRPRWWSLHAVVGTWVLPVYLVIALTGLTWSYDWFKDGANRLLTGKPTETAGEAPRMREGGRKASAGEPSPKRPAGALDRALAAFQSGEGHEAALSVVTLPGPEGKAIRIRWIAKGDAPGARNEARFDAATGAPLAASRDADLTLGERIAGNMLEVHRGRFFGEAFALVFCLAALLMPGFAATGLTLYVLRRRARSRRNAAARAPVATGGARTVS